MFSGIPDTPELAETYYSQFEDEFEVEDSKETGCDNKNSDENPHRVDVNHIHFSKRIRKNFSAVDPDSDDDDSILAEASAILSDIMVNENEMTELN